jgi:homoserine O-acetyltransferase
MKQVRKRVALAIISALVAVVWVGGVESGAPAPAPTASSGPHLPKHQIANLGDFRFEGGEVITDLKVSYVTHGKLNRTKSNAVVVLQHFTADHHALDFLIGPGKALDPEKYFIVAPDFLGNSLVRQDVTTGPTNSGLRMEFPAYTVRDWVNVDYKLLKEYLGIDHVLAVTGASIGAMKSYQFAVSYPNYLDGAIPIAGSPVTSAKTRWVLRNMMNIIALDPAWYSGTYDTNPTPGLISAFMAIVPWWYTDRWFVANMRTVKQRRQFEAFWRDLFVLQAPQDARDVYYQLQAWAEFNVGDGPFRGDAVAALRSVKAKVLLIGVKDDLLVDREEVLLAKRSIPNAVHVEIDSAWGHIACCGLDPQANNVIDREIASFLSKLR